MASLPPHSSVPQGVTRIWAFGTCELDEARRELRLRGQAVELESKPLDLLCQLLIHAGEVVTKEELLETVWPGTTVVDGSLATAISKLRRALGDPHADAILTLPRVGYRFTLPVRTRTVPAGLQTALELHAGASVPGREQWRLCRPLDAAGAVWLAEHAKTRLRHVFKFAHDGLRLAALKREVTLHRYLADSLGSPAFLVRLLEWNFDTAPYWVESAYEGANLQEHAESLGGLAAIPLAERLGWLAQVAAAVGRAHDVGVLHKDIKPANILIAPATAGEPAAIRLADFGSGVLQDPARLGALGITNHGFTAESSAPEAITGTLVYLAPEILSGHSATAQADIYSLGVLLFQLIAADFRLPLTPGWENAVEDPLLRQDIAEAASGEPALRIKSAAELAERLVTLHQRRLRYNELATLRLRAEQAERTAHLMRARRPWIITAGAALTLGAVLSLTLYLRAVSERDKADRQTALANTINRFLSQDLLGRGNPFRTGKAQESFTEAIQHAAPSIDTQFAGEPLVAAHLHLTIAHALDGRSNFTDARLQYLRASQLFRAAQGDLAEDAILADLQRAFMQGRAYQKDLLVEARSLLSDQQSRLARIAHPREDLLVWRDSVLGIIALVDNDIDNSSRFFQQAVDRARALPAFEPLDRLNLQQRLAFTFIRRGDGATAEQHFLELRQAYSAIEGPGGADVLRTRLNLAQAYMIQQKHEQAITEVTAIYPLLVATLGADHELTLQAMTTRAESEASLGHWQDAIRDDLDVYRAATLKQGPHSFYALGTLSDAALAQCRATDFAEGLENARKAYDRARESFGPKSGLAGGTAYTLAECSLGAGKFAEASALLDLIDIPLVAQLAGDADWGANVFLARARILFHQNRLAEARAQLKLAQPAFDKPAAEPYQRHAFAELAAALKL